MPTPGKPANVCWRGCANINQPMEVGFNGLYSSMIIDLFAHIAQAFPSVHFFVRGVGEEFDDM